MPGTLTIHSNGAGTEISNGNILSGHSWIEYHKDGEAQSKCYGTWGNNPGGRGNGLHEDLEKGRPSEASASVRLTDEQETKLFAKINQYKALGSNGWQYGNPCSGIASDAFGAGSGHQLNSRTGLISNPSQLKSSINEFNKGLGVNADQRVANAVGSSVDKSVTSSPGNSSSIAGGSSVAAPVASSGAAAVGSTKGAMTVQKNSGNSFGF
jgi:hypothetical protein